MKKARQSTKKMFIASNKVGKSRLVVFEALSRIRRSLVTRKDRVLFDKIVQNVFGETNENNDT